MNRQVTRILLVVAVLLLLAFFLTPQHIRRAVIYGHANIDDYKIFDNRIVKNAGVIPWKHDSLYNLNKIAPKYLQVLDSFGTTAFVVIHNNKIIHEEYWDGASDTTRSNSFSAAKSIVSLLIGCLIDEGKIKNTDQAVGDFIPEFKNSENFTFRIKDLLTMSSGINWAEGYSSLFSPTTKAYYGNQLESQMLGLEFKSSPGKTFEYQSCNTQILSMIIEKASGKTLSEYASEKLWRPLGAGHPAFWSLDRKDGVEKAYCCFNSTATDFARIGQMILDSGQFNHTQIVSKAYITQATTPATYLKDEQGDSCYYYGYQFWMMTNKGHKVVYARGILGQYIFIIPSLNTVVVRLGTDRSKQSVYHAPMEAYSYLDAAFDLIGIKE